MEAYPSQHLGRQLFVLCILKHGVQVPPFSVSRCQVMIKWGFIDRVLYTLFSDCGGGSDMFDFPDTISPIRCHLILVLCQLLSCLD